MGASTIILPYLVLYIISHQVNYKFHFGKAGDKVLLSGSYQVNLQLNRNLLV